MRLTRLALGGLACLLLATAARADSPTDPLRLVPSQADFFLEIQQPRRLIEGGLHHELFQAAQALPPVREAYDSTNARRFLQLVAHLEKKLGAPWPELLDRLAGGGIVLAGKFAADPAPALLVIQGKEAELSKRFFDAAREVIEAELVRQESKEKVEKQSYRGAEAVSVGKDFHAAVAGSTILISNKKEALKLALDLKDDGPAGSLASSEKVAAATKTLPSGPLARLFINLDAAHQSPQGKELFVSPRNDPIVTVLFGGLIDTVGRAPYVAAGLYEDNNGLLTTIRLPAGRDGSSADLALHAPPKEGQGVRPPLEPKGALLSVSFYFDFAALWNQRTKLFSEQNAKNLENVDQQTQAFLAGSQFSALLQQAGARHRFVVVNPLKSSYKKKPDQTLPSFAFVTELRKPDEFTQTIDAVIKGGLLLAGGQLGLKAVTEKVGGHVVNGYRFLEDKPLPQDMTNARFNFSPCYVRVGNQLAFCSTLEMAREVVPLLDKEAKTKAVKLTDAAARVKLYGTGAAEALRLAEDQVLSQLVLDQAVPIAEARKQFQTLVGLARRLGNVQFETTYEAKQLRYDLRLSPGK